MTSFSNEAGSNPDSAIQLLHVFSSFEIGGAQRRFATLVDALGARYRHTVVAMDGRYSALQLIEHARLVHSRPIKLVKGRGLSPSNLYRMRKFLQAVGAQKLITYNWGAIEWALANRFHPFCAHIHIEDGFSIAESETRQLKRRAYFRRAVLSGSHTRVVVPSKTLLAVARRHWRLARDQMLYLPNGIDLALLDRERRMAARQRDESDPLIVGTLAALRPEKNLSALLRAFAALQADTPAKLMIAGDGPVREDLKAEAQELGIGERVVFPGYIRNPGAFLAQLDIFALSSLTEQMPYSVLEAMACGLPVVATSVGDVPDLLSEANHLFLCAPGDIQSLAEGLRRLAQDGSLRASIGSTNMQKARTEFDIAKMIERYDALFSGSNFRTREIAESQSG